MVCRIEGPHRWIAALAAATTVVLACNGAGPRAASPSARPTESGAAEQINPHAGAAIDPGSLPSCFVAAEPASLPTGARTASFGPYRQARPGATPQAGPQIAALLARAPFPVYALDEPVASYTPIQLRLTTYPAAGAPRPLLVALQYRIAPRAGGGVLIVLSGPSPGGAPPRDDLDDAIDAVRLEARLDGLPATPDPLADPATALGKLGCPMHSALTLTLHGKPADADLITWPGAPHVQLLRLEAGATEVTLEAGEITHTALLQLAAALQPASTGSAMARTLAAVFDGPPAGVPTAAPPRSAPTRSPALRH
ncbi:MAG TPA: hypothetical protein VFA70_15960 [Dehalococcoidia bacterium]|jgi:hypothetical protein|nr:hypothetical protein [Dehalococcoidia bacterium]